MSFCVGTLIVILVVLDPVVSRFWYSKSDIHRENLKKAGVTILGAVGPGTDSTEAQTSKSEATTCTLKKNRRQDPTAA